MRRLTRTLVVVFSLLLLVSISTRPAKADCVNPQRITYTYVGMIQADGSVWCAGLIGPTPVIQVVGQKTINCNGTISTWGTVCPNTAYNPSSVDYEDCICRPGE